MIEEIRLKNFQCHKRRVIKLQPGVNVLVGENDSGKTAILRMLRWLALNDTRGDRYVHHGADRASGTVVVGGLDVVRKKGPGGNSYFIGDKEYVSFGVGKVPDQVAETLLLEPINFQDQGDPPFWFGLTPGQVSKELNEIINLEAIDRSLSAIGKRIRKTKARIEVHSENVQTAREERDRLSWVAGFQEAFAIVKSEEAKVLSHSLACERLTVLCHTIANLTGQRTRDVAARNTASLAIAAGKDWYDQTEAVAEFSSLLECIGRSEVAARTKVPNMERVRSAREKLLDLRERVRKLREAVTAAEAAKEIKCQLSVQKTAIEKTLEENRPKLCPTCGQTLPSHTC